MPDYFASDIHLRLDRPDRAARFGRWVSALEPDDSLTIVGDLCDFWFAARERTNGPPVCQGLRALADFRERGGTITILAGNHDLWLEDDYERIFGARFQPEPLLVESHGLRLHLVHGHLLGARRAWKAYMEGKMFLRAFHGLPGPLARGFDSMLEFKNRRGLLADEERHLAMYRTYTEACAETADVVVIGHVHRPVDEQCEGARLIVLGGWQRRSSYLKIDSSGARLVIEPNVASVTR